MNERDWEKFFDLVDNIVNNMPGKSWQEKKQKILDEAMENACEGTFEEFVGWFKEAD